MLLSVTSWAMDSYAHSFSFLSSSTTFSITFIPRKPVVPGPRACFSVTFYPLCTCPFAVNPIARPFSFLKSTSTSGRTTCPMRPIIPCFRAGFCFTFARFKIARFFLCFYFPITENSAAKSRSQLYALTTSNTATCPI